MLGSKGACESQSDLDKRKHMVNCGIHHNHCCVLGQGERGGGGYLWGGCGPCLKWGRIPSNGDNHFPLWLEGYL